VLRAKVPRYFGYGERKVHGAKVPGSESSTYGTFALESESTWERKFHNSFGSTSVGDCVTPSTAVESVTENVGKSVFYIVTYTEKCHQKELVAADAIDRCAGAEIRHRRWTSHEMLLIRSCSFGRLQAERSFACTDICTLFVFRAARSIKPQYTDRQTERQTDRTITEECRQKTQTVEK